MNWQRAVVKVGSALIAPDGQACSGQYVLAIAQFVTQASAQGKEVILVSSGSVAAGRQLIKHSAGALSIPVKQAMAAVGQTQMMANWQRFFDKPCSQLLITHGDLKDRERYINIKNTLRTLLANQCLPIVNENDTVATDELKVGDNDNLAAQVALVSEADCLIILSDVDGVFTKNPHQYTDAKLIKEFSAVSDEVYAMAGGTHNTIGTGGMKTKIQAAEKATKNGIQTYIVNGQHNTTFEQLLKGENPGSHFLAAQTSTKAKKHWLKHTLKSHGQIIIDAGAANAVLNKGASLLATGIVEVKGDFQAGESVSVIANDNRTLAQGICQYNSSDLARIKGQKSDDIATILGCCPSKEIIHRDDLALL